MSYFDAYALARIAERAGWTVEDAGTLFGGMFRFVELSANVPAQRGGRRPVPDTEARDRQLAAVAGFQERHERERTAWQTRIGELVDRGAKPALWGAGSRGVQFLTFADADKRLSAVVDVNPRKWGRYLPVTAHRVERPDVLATLKPQAVIITNPSYRHEIEAHLERLGVAAELLVA